MGAFYGSVQVRSDDRDSVLAVAGSVAATLEARCLVGPVINGWIGVYPSMNGQDERVGAGIAAEISADVLQLIVHDDDVFAYWLYREGERVDSFWSVPGYFGEQYGADQKGMAGNVEVFRPIVGNQISQLESLLVRGEEQELCAEEQLVEFAKVLKISNALTAYEYLKDGETEEIKKWKQFQEVPAELVAETRNDARQLRKEVESTRKKFKADGLLLLHDEWKEGQSPRGCAIENGFVVAWTDHRADTVQFARYESPWIEKVAFELKTSKHVADLASDGSQKRMAVSAGDNIHVFELVEGKWLRVADVPERDLTNSAVLSADGKILAHTSREEIVVTQVEESRRVCAIPQKLQARRQMAFHPSGEWLAVATGTSFGLISIREQPNWRDIYVGGKKEMASHVRLISSEMQKIDADELERLQRADLGKMIEKLQKPSGKRKPPVMSEADIQKFRESMEQGIEETKTRIRDWKEGRMPEEPAQSEVYTCSVGFSRDGKWLWCGSDRGIHVYDWAKVPREAGSELFDPVWKIDLPGDPHDPLGANRVWAISEEVGHSAIVFTGSRGILYRLELGSGQLHELIKLAGDAWVCGLAMSADGSALGVMVGTMLFTESARRHGERKWAWEVWSYPRLIEQLQTPSLRLWSES